MKDLIYIAKAMGYVTPCHISILVPNIRTGYAYVEREGKNTVAHKYLYERKKGKVPDGLELDHLCGIRNCINLEHLEPVTRTENIRRSRKTKLTVELVREIKTLLLGGYTQIDVGRKFGLKFRHINDIARHKIWTDILVTR